MDINDLIKAKRPGYLLKRHEDAHKLRALLSEKNWTEIQMIGHQLKGNGATFGFIEISEIGAALEAGAKKKAEGTTLTLIEKLESILKNAKA